MAISVSPLNALRSQFTFLLCPVMQNVGWLINHTSNNRVKLDTRGKEMRKLHFSIVLFFLMMVLSFSYAFSGEITSLSKKASRLKLRMSRQEVISLLGHPTWAVIPGDKGDLALPDPRIRLELYWKNTPCSPVIVQFDSAYKTTGWDQGRAVCGKDVHLFDPPKEYLCGKADRSKLCK